MREKQLMFHDITKVSIYPNPVSNVLFVDVQSMKEVAIYNLLVYDMAGKKLFEAEIDGNAITSLNTASLPKGLLLIQVREDGQTIMIEKVVNQ